MYKRITFKVRCVDIDFHITYSVPETVQVFDPTDIMHGNPPNVVLNILTHLDKVNWADYMDATTVKASIFDYFEIFNKTTRYQAVYAGVICSEDHTQTFKVTRIVYGVELYNFINISDVVWYTGDRVKLLVELIQYIFSLNSDYTIYDIRTVPDDNVAINL